MPMTTSQKAEMKLFQDHLGKEIILPTIAVTTLRVCQNRSTQNKRRTTKPRKEKLLGTEWVFQLHLLKKVSECAYCLQKITRGTWHTVKKSRQGYKSWAIIKHYHLGCIGHLSPTEREQLLAIVGASDEVSDNVREDLKEQIDKLNRNMDRRG